MSVKLTFLGAAQTVTGSKYLVEGEGKKVLIDCGLFQGRKELRLRNWEEPRFDVRDLSAIVLTHAHIDHSGYLPLVVKRGYVGPIYCTAATKELLNLLLLDSAHLQEEEARFAEQHGTSRHNPPKPLYNQDDVRATLRLLKVIERDKPNIILPKFTVSPTCAGHILGATSLNLDVGAKRITFSGDIGRYDVPILPDPQPTDIGDLLLCESTYGDRLHGDEDAREHFAAVVRRVVDRKGPLIIPAFALGRTQTLLYYISTLESEGKIPVLPVFVDSPMAVDATEIYRRYNYDFDAETKTLIEQGRSPFVTENLKFCKEVEASKAINNVRGPRIIISASGMVTGGRIMHHLKNWLPEENTTVLFVGYQGEDTRGATILSGAPYVRIFGQDVAIRAHVESISSLSAHGDYKELIRWLKSCKGGPQFVKIVHGEEHASQVFSERVKAELQWRADPAKHLESIEI